MGRMRFGDEVTLSTSSAEVGKNEVAAQNLEKNTTNPSARGNLIFLVLASGLSPKFLFLQTPVKPIVTTLNVLLAKLQQMFDYVPNFFFLIVLIYNFLGNC